MIIVAITIVVVVVVVVVIIVSIKGACKALRQSPAADAKRPDHLKY